MTFKNQLNSLPNRQNYVILPKKFKGEHNV